MRRANKKDLVHRTIVDGLRQRGIVVYDMPEPGDVLCYQFDARVFYPHRPDPWMQFARWLPLEIKTPGIARTRKSQQKRSDGSRIRATRPDGSRYWLDVPPAPIPVVETLEQALALFGLE